MPHGQCYLWRNDLIYLHAISDALIALAYYSIPLTILYFLRKRQDVPFPTIFLMFGAFILSCGTTHLIEVGTIWQPWYWTAGWIKAITAAVSVATAVALVRIMPQALELPSPGTLRQLNEELEGRVAARTADLTAAKEGLEREVAQRQQAEAEVRRLNESLKHRVHELEIVLDLLPVGIAIAQDQACREIRTNRLLAQMLGIPEKSNASLSTPDTSALPSFRLVQKDRELRPDELPMQRAARENIEIRDFEATVVRGDGRELQAVFNVVPLRDAAGNARGAVASIQDVTTHQAALQDRLAFERRFQEMQKLESLGILAGGIAHDFNNLLTGVLGNASLARLELPPGHAGVRAALDNIEHSAMRAGDLCKQMLAYAGKGRFVVQPLSISGIVRETTELLEVSISKKVRLKLELGEVLPAVMGDATQVRQVLMNLVLNASEAIGDRDGTITIRTDLVHLDNEYIVKMAFSERVNEGDFISIEVSDTGSGMDPETLGRIFDPFFTTKFTGRGLGLAAVLGIVRGHKGAIKVWSEEGKGTTFKLFLPATNRPATPPAPIVNAAAQAKNTGRILLVDDEPAVRITASRILRNGGYEVVEAEDGAQAVEIFRAHAKPFTAVLMDLTMPRMDGGEALKAIREIDPTARVLLMSGFNEQDTVSRFAGRGLTGFIPKPFTAEVLLQRLREALSGGRRV